MTISSKFGFLSLLSLSNAKALWSSSPATNYSDIIREAYLVGNGRLGAMPFGSPGEEKIVLNIDSLWSGGPFQADNYTGGNTVKKYQYLPDIRDWIFQNATGNISGLLGDGDAYGSYQVAGNFSISHNATLKPGTYKRTLDLSTGIHTTKFSNTAGHNFTMAVWCSYPDQVCVYQIDATTTLPELRIKLENQLVNDTLAECTCGDGYARLRGVTQVGPPEGMIYESVARIVHGANSTSSKCDEQSGTLIITQTQGMQSIGLVVGSGTNYDQTKGNAANDYSFKGEDPREQVNIDTEAAASKTTQELDSRHLEDYGRLMDAFSLELPDPYNSSNIETSLLFEQYTSERGDPFIESLLFDYGRYLLFSSSRPNSLPANLQGRWSSGLFAAWSADYHANINIQMNYWGAEQTGLSGIQDGLWAYMRDTWVPRGTETAHLLYDAPGWVVHNEMNIFGHTAMKSDAQWANYPASAAWMMQHVTDHFEYTQDTTWLRETGYPLLKGVTEFWLSQLQPYRSSNDTNSNNSTTKLVVNPCNSPEHGPTTVACTHYHQLIHYIFAYTLRLAPLVSDTDPSFLKSLSHALDRLDIGPYFTSWGSIAEWQHLPPELEAMYDGPDNEHRHLSHLWGWYPGSTLYSQSHPPSQNSTTTPSSPASPEDIQKAVHTSLLARGPGNAPDANAAWAKVWRAACWARLGSSSPFPNATRQAYFELKYAAEQNFVGNALSMYSGENEPFQIDANLGWVGAVTAMLILDVDDAWFGAAGGGGGGGEGEREVVLGPAIPEEWGDGEVKGMRVRGGGAVDFGWDAMGVVTWVRVAEVGSARDVRFVDREGRVVERRGVN